METRRIRILYIEDSFDLVLAYRMMLDRDPRFEDVGARSSADGILEEVKRSSPDVVLMDLTMQGFPPLQAIRLLAAEAPQVRTIAYSGYDDNATQQGVYKAGGWGFLSKCTEPTRLLADIYRIATAPRGSPGGATGRPAHAHPSAPGE